MHLHTFVFNNMQYAYRKSFNKLSDLHVNCTIMDSYVLLCILKFITITTICLMFVRYNLIIELSQLR